jgi:hypothetical protein
MRRVLIIFQQEEVEVENTSNNKAARHLLSKDNMRSLRVDFRRAVVLSDVAHLLVDAETIPIDGNGKFFVGGYGSEVVAMVDHVIISFRDEGKVENSQMMDQVYFSVQQKEQDVLHLLLDTADW